jgi:hypothetical protein
MTTRLLILSVIATAVIGMAIAFLWVQVGLPTGITYAPWDSPIHLFPSLFAFWIPLIYLFFTSIWLYFSQKPLSRQERLFFGFDQYSYVVVLIFFLLQIAWRELGSPALWFRGFILALLLLKSFLVFCTLYHSPQRIQPVLLIVLGVGLHILVFLFGYQTLSLPITDLFRRAELVQLALIVAKSFCLNLMTLEMFRLGVEMAKSVQSAFFSWLSVTLTFPVVGFPKIFYILAGLLIIFVLRMIFSRLDTRELMVGLFTTTRIMILLKLLLVIGILVVAGTVFWGNVKPGFEFQGSKAFQVAIGTLFDGQFGVLCYAPMYWLALFGVVYLLFFKVWDGVLLIITGGILYLGYHLAVYGMLGRSIEQSDSVPFLPILGVFMAIAHTRFGKMVLFRCGIRFAAIVTVGITSLLILLYPNFTSIPAKIAEIERAVITSLGTDITYIVPSMVFRPFPLSFFIWTGLIALAALFFCYSRTRSASLLARKTKPVLEQYLHFREFTFSPCLLFVFLLVGTLIIRYGDNRVSVPLNQPLHLSRSQRQEEILINNSSYSTGIFIASNVTGSIMILHGTPVASVIIVGQDQRFETFTVKIGKDTSEETLEQRGVKSKVAHGRATIHRSWTIVNGDGVSFAAHDYYTKFFFSKPLKVQKITLKFLDPKPEEVLSEIALHIKEIALF